jgi:hypothetical protein
LSSTNPNLGFTYDAAGNMTKGYTPQGEKEGSGLPLTLTIKV